MPRKSPRKSIPKKINIQQKSEPKQLVFIMPDKILNNDQTSNGKITRTQLRHPKTGDGNLYLINSENNSICEILKYTERPRSWFLGNTVEQDGSLHVCTEINPLFLILPYISKVNKFMLLDQVLSDDEFPEISKLVHFITSKQLDFITDTKSLGDEIVYKYNEEKTLNWLTKRTEKLATELEIKGIHACKGARSATFVRSKKDEKADKNDYIKYACGLVCEYIDAKLSDKLHQHLKIETKKEETSVDEPPPKRAKMEKSGEPIEDYSDKKETKSKPQLKKLSNIQKQLEKVDKTGMKNISSFFTKKK